MEVLTGISDSCENIIKLGDDSADELGAIASECFEKWHELASREDLPMISEVIFSNLH